MSNSVTVDVTEEDIKNGKMGDCYYCPIALAVCRAMKVSPKDAVIEVDTTGIQDLVEGVWFTSPEVCDFVVSFDKNRDLFVKPFSFELNLEPQDND